MTAGAGVVGVDVPDLLMGGDGVTSRALRFAAILRAEGAELWTLGGFNGRGLELWPWEAVEYLGDTKLDRSRAIGLLRSDSRVYLPGMVSPAWRLG